MRCLPVESTRGIRVKRRDPSFRGYCHRATIHFYETSILSIR